VGLYAVIRFRATRAPGCLHVDGDRRRALVDQERASL
jgi:hypothetical protein